MLSGKAVNHPSSPPDPTETEISGQLLGITKEFPNGDSITVIARLADGRLVKGKVETVDELGPGNYYLFTGRWDEHPKWGWQFSFNGFIADVPRKADDAIAYLTKFGDCIGKKRAQKLAEAYGDNAVHVLLTQTRRVVDDGLLSESAAETAVASLREVCDPALREAHEELWKLLRAGGGGFYGATVKQLLRMWGRRAPDLVRRDPFRLLVKKLPGCGFLRTDRLYLSLGHAADALKRQTLAAWYELSQASKSDGDTWISLDRATGAIRDRVGGTTAKPRRAFVLGYRAKWIDCQMDDRGGIWVAERSNARAERRVAQHVRRLRGTTKINWPQGPFADLSEHQQEQIRIGLQGAISILTGSPGTGKTFVASRVIRAIADTGGIKNTAVICPTGKASVRITESMRAAGLPLNATTIHKLLGVRGNGSSFAFNEDCPLPYRYVVVDEVSMLSTDLAASLFAACADGSHVLLVGDVHQLPPVGHGAPLRDLLDAGVPAARLSEIRRNSGLIVESCARIKDGESFEPLTRLDDWNAQRNLVHLATRRKDNVLDKLMAVYDWLGLQSKWDLIDDVQVLSAKNDTRRKLNRELQLRLNRDGEGTHKVFKIGDKVINTKNNFFTSASSRVQEYIANGDIGRVQAFQGRQMTVRLSSPERRVVVPLGRVAEASDDDNADEADNTGCTWGLAYCCTTHKFQGSEVPVVVAFVEPAGFLCSREWIYTAISRAKELCILIGTESDIKRCIKNSILPKRKTFLADLVRESTP
jgi:exodeoxyribonuclease V alpha subunit